MYLVVKGIDLDLNKPDIFSAIKATCFNYCFGCFIYLVIYFRVSINCTHALFCGMNTSCCYFHSQQVTHCSFNLDLNSQSPFHGKVCVCERENVICK